MQKSCEDCGAPFEAKRAAARFCSERCKKRAQRKARSRPPSPSPGMVTARPAAAVSGLLASAEARLAAAGRLDGPEGQAAMILAARIEMSALGAETGSGVASLVRQFHASMAEALKDADRGAADPVDELRTRRELKLSAG